MSYGYYNPNQPVINQLMRQKDNIDNLLNQYAQPPMPVQNIINTVPNTDFEARILTDNEDVENILISKRTMFLDKTNKRVLIKELDGRISETYEIIIPLDEKDKRILELENKLKDMEDKINVKYGKPIRTTDKCKQSNTNDNVNTGSSTKTDDSTISEPESGTTSSNISNQV